MGEQCRNVLHPFGVGHMRLNAVGLAHHDGFAFPLTQRELSECLGLTVVHANRTIQELRRRGLVELENRYLTILDRRGLPTQGMFRSPTFAALSQTSKQKKRSPQAISISSAIRGRAIL